MIYKITKYKKWKIQRVNIQMKNILKKTYKTMMNNWLINNKS